jgi:mono/diheme cytochrome c family protein
MRMLTVAFFASLATAGVRAEEPIVLKPGPGRDKVAAHCGACHSLDYIVMNSPFLTQAQWQGEVKKMIEAFKAPIDPEDAARITEYLASNYGG